MGESKRVEDTTTDPSLARVDALLADLEQHGVHPRPRKLGSRQVLAIEGNTTGDIWFVQSGLLLSARTDERGTLIPAGLHPPGSSVGLIESLNTRGTFRSTITALTPCTLIGIRPNELELRIQQSPAVFRSVLDIIEGERDFLGKIGIGLLGNTVKVRLLKLLLELRHPFGLMRDDGVLALTLPLPRNVIATLIGTCPETMSRLVRELSLTSVLSFEGPTVLIPDLDAVFDIVAEEAA